MNISLCFLMMCLTILLYLGIYLPYFKGIDDAIENGNPKFI